MIFYYFGEYLLLLKKVFRKPEKWRIYMKEIFHEMTEIGVGSLGLIVIISTFIGAVMTMQIAFQLVSDLIPTSVIGQINRDSNIFRIRSHDLRFSIDGESGVIYFFSDWINAGN